MFINWKTKELDLNIVYAGVALSGKTTNLEQIHSHIRPEYRIQLTTLQTNEDRTIFFDFLHLNLNPIAGLTPKFGLYTVPGQVYYEATRDIILNKADGIVFVVDCASKRIHENLEAWQSLREKLAARSEEPGKFPTVIQFNKCDLPDAVETDEIKSLLKVESLPCFEAVAINYQGVNETLFAIIKGVFLRATNSLKQRN